MRTLATTYTAIRYGPMPARDADVTEAWNSVDELQRVLREDAAFPERWRRRVDPAPLRRN
jgi:hypothetical protein